MNNKYSWILLSILLAFTSCKTSKNATLAKQDDKLANALLWEIKVDGAEKPSYVFGTIHMIGKEDYFLPKGTLAAMEESKKMIFEIDIADMNDMGSLMGIMNKIFMNDGGTLKDLLNEADYKIVTDHFSDMGLPMMMLEKIKPMFLSAFAYADHGSKLNE